MWLKKNAQYFNFAFFLFIGNCFLAILLYNEKEITSELFSGKDTKQEL